MPRATEVNLSVVQPWPVKKTIEAARMIILPGFWPSLSTAQRLTERWKSWSAFFIGQENESEPMMNNTPKAIGWCVGRQLAHLTGDEVEDTSLFVQTKVEQTSSLSTAPQFREAVEWRELPFITGEVNREGGTDDRTTFSKTIRLVHGGQLAYLTGAGKIRAHRR